jgi:hypothetical protein
VLEASSGASCEDVCHSKGDALKLILSATEILKAEYLNSLDETLSTYLKRKLLMIQTTTSKMTLSSMSLLNAERYEVAELRSAEIPLTWHDRSN